MMDWLFSPAGAAVFYILVIAAVFAVIHHWPAAVVFAVFALLAFYDATRGEVRRR